MRNQIAYPIQEITSRIALAMTQAQFVTVPILDARFHVLEGKLDASIQAHKADMQRLSAELNAKLAELEAKLVRWVFLVMLGNVALSLAANTILNAFKTL